MTPEEKSINILRPSPVIKTVGLIVSCVFFCLAISEIKKINKNVYFKLSIAFLVVTSSIYVILILILIGYIGVLSNISI